VSYTDGDICPVCGEGVLEMRVVNERYGFGGRELTVPDYVMYRCLDCGENVLDLGKVSWCPGVWGEV